MFNLMNNLKQLPRLLAFAEVAAKGSFTQAANALGMTKSAISQQISLLEQDLGLQLLTRTTRGVQATAIGRQLLQRCQLLQDQVELIQSDIQNALASPSGVFSVTFPHALENYVVIPAISQLCREFPGLRPKLLVSDETLDLIQDKIDISIHAGQLNNSSYRALLAGQVKELFCASPRYLQNQGQPTRPEHLSDHQWIATSWQSSPLTISLDSNPKDDANPYTIKLTPFAKVNTLPSAIQLAINDMGIALVPAGAAQPYLASGQLVHILPDYRGPIWPIYLLHAYQTEKPIHLSRFQQLVSYFLKTY